MSGQTSAFHSRARTIPDGALLLDHVEEELEDDAALADHEGRHRRVMRPGN
ncbi:hypothetical protein ACQEU6_20735 [Spirillospora sp. CA-108201]